MDETPAWGNRTTAEQKRKGWEMAVRIEKLLCTVLQEVHKRQVDETMETLAEGPEGFYSRYLDR
jgi:phage tail sheath protein FI